MLLGKIVNYRRSGNRIIINAERGEVILRFITENIINVFIPVESNVQESKAIEQLEEQEVALTITESEYYTGNQGHADTTEKEHHRVLIISSASLSVEVHNPFALVFKDALGRVINRDYCGTDLPTEKPVAVYKVLNHDEHFYGFGEKAGFLDKAGAEVTMWNSDISKPHVPSMHALYKSIPFFIGLRQGVAYGIFFDNTYKTHFDMGKWSREYYSFAAEGGNIDYYFIYGPEIKEVITGYTHLTGRITLPPLWALGYQQSRYSYFPESQVMEIAETFREKDIPCDVIYLDIDYMDGYRVFTFDEQRFPNPKAMIERLGEMGFKVVPIVDPGVKVDKDYKVYQEMIENHYYVTTADGLPYVGKVWPGDVVFPDFTDAPVREWWGDQHKVYLEAGIAGIWNDMNEPAVFTGKTENLDEYKTMPLSNMHKNDGRPVSQKEMHNLYALMMAKSTHAALSKMSDRRPFILSRAGYAGIQKYAALWTGDNYSFWDHLGMAMPMCMNLGLSGVPFIGTDVGGFSYDCTPELLARWTQLGAFTPFFRNHTACDTRSQEPWVFDRETEAINRKYIKLRYKLLPYIYNLFVEASQTGLPVMRPLVLEYPEDAEVYSLYDQFMIGSNLLIAPVTTPGNAYRHVYLPAGEWVDYWTGEQYSGKQHILAHAPLDTLPIYVKAGSILPTYEPLHYVGEKRNPQVTLEIYPGEGTYNYYEDDGETFAFRQGEYNLTTFETRIENGTTILQVAPRVSGYSGNPTFSVQFVGISAHQAQVNGREVKLDIIDGKLTLALPAKEKLEVRVF